MCNAFNKVMPSHNSVITLFDPLLNIQRKPDGFQALEPNY